MEYYRREGLTAELHSLQQMVLSAGEKLREMDDIEGGQHRDVNTWQSVARGSAARPVSEGSAGMNLLMADLQLY